MKSCKQYNSTYYIPASCIVNKLIFFLKTGSIKYEIKWDILMFICLVISHEFSTVVRFHPQFGRQFATAARSNNLYYCGFPVHLGALIPFSDSGTLMYTERWVAFFNARNPKHHSSTSNANRYL